MGDWERRNWRRILGTEIVGIEIGWRNEEGGGKKLEVRLWRDLEIEEDEV